MTAEEATGTGDSLAVHAPLLLLEASGPRVQVGVWDAGQWTAFASSDAPALESLTSLVAEVLGQAGIKLGEVGGFLYDEGPGAVLGLRLAAMTLRTWQALPEHRDAPVFAFGSLELAIAVLEKRGLRPPYALVTEAGLNRWLLLEKPDLNTPTDPHLVDARALAQVTGTLHHLAQRKQWKPLPREAEPFALDLAAFPELFLEPNLTHPVSQPTPLLPAAKDYVKWSGQRHRG